MIKKIFVIFIMMLLIGTVFLPLASSMGKNNDDNNLISNDKIEDKKIQIMSYLPDYFNWRDYNGLDWTTPAKNQLNCGSCWAFGALGVIESAINIGEGMADLDPDLSEQYVLSCLYGGSCSGGFDTNAFKAIIDNTSRGNGCNGIILEQCMLYQASDGIPCEDKSENWQDFLVPLLNYEVFNCRQNNSEDRDVIKSLIMENGPVTATMFVTHNFTNWGYTHHNIDDYFSYVYSNTLNHCVNIIGWKDDPNIGNGGYWICKNSIGHSFGYDGFFNIEYGSLYIDGGYVAYAEYDPESYDWHPVPKTDGPYYGLVDELLAFYGDAQGEHPPFSYHWDFGDGSTSTEQNPSYSYSNPGYYIVKLTVTDDTGNSFYVETSAWVQETNDPPAAPRIEGPVEVKEGEYCWYNFTFDDPDGSPVYLYVDVFGKESGIWWGPYPPGYGVQNINYFWEEEGDFIVKAKVKDPYGAESDWAILEVTVSKSKSINELNPWIGRIIERFPILELLI